MTIEQIIMALMSALLAFLSAYTLFRINKKDKEREKETQSREEFVHDVDERFRQTNEKIEQFKDQMAKEFKEINATLTRLESFNRETLFRNEDRDTRRSELVARVDKLERNYDVLNKQVHDIFSNLKQWAKVHNTKHPESPLDVIM